MPWVHRNSRAATSGAGCPGVALGSGGHGRDSLGVKGDVIEGQVVCTAVNLDLTTGLHTYLGRYAVGDVRDQQLNCRTITHRQREDRSARGRHTRGCITSQLHLAKRVLTEGRWGPSC